MCVCACIRECECWKREDIFFFLNKEIRCSCNKFFSLWDQILNIIGRVKLFLKFLHNSSLFLPLFQNAKTPPMTQIHVGWHGGGGRESPSHYINWQEVLPDSTKHLHHFRKLSLCILPTRVCVCIPQAATEDHGICRDAERRGHQGCGPGLSKWVRKRACMHAHTHTHFGSRADGMQLKVLCSNIIFRCFAFLLSNSIIFC